MGVELSLLTIDFKTVIYYGSFAINLEKNTFKS